MSCPIDPVARHDYHCALVEGPLAAWNQLPARGTQPVADSGGIPGYTLELRECLGCGSVLSRPLGQVVAGDELTAHIRDVIERFFRTRLNQSHFRTQRQAPYIVLQANVGTRVFLDHLAKAISDELEKDS